MKEDNVIYQGKLCSIWKLYDNDCDILLPERNVNLDSLSNFCDGEYKEKDFVLYTKNDQIEVVKIIKLDKYYGFAQVRILKTRVPYKLIRKMN